MGKKPPQRRGRFPKEKKEFEEEVLQVDRVTRVVKGGRRLSFRATVIIGNRKGKVAIGLGKSTEVAAAIKKAVSRAKKDILLVPIINDTIPHEVKVKYKANYLLMIPASAGTGIKAGSSTRKILELAGIKNILAKRMGSNNRINLAKATMKALKELTEKVEPKELKGEAAAPQKPRTGLKGSSGPTKSVGQGGKEDLPKEEATEEIKEEAKEAATAEVKEEAKEAVKAESSAPQAAAPTAE